MLTIDVPTERKPFFSIRNLNDDADQSWDIAIPTRAITGRVFDRRTNEAIVGAEVVDHVVPRTPGRLPPRIWDLVTGPFSGVALTGQDGRLTIPSLPVGTYEFWPYHTVDDLQHLFTSVYTRPPTRVVLSPGPNTVKIDVDRAH